MEKIKSTNDELKKEILENLVQQRISKLAEQLDQKMGTNQEYDTNLISSLYSLKAKYQKKINF